MSKRAEVSQLYATQRILNSKGLIVEDAAQLLDEDLISQILEMSSQRTEIDSRLEAELADMSRNIHEKIEAINAHLQASTQIARVLGNLCLEAYYSIYLEEYLADFWESR